MKKYINIALCAFLSALIGISCNTRAQNSETQLSKKDNETPKVYMFKEISPENLVKIYEALNRKATGKVAVKLSTGEPGGHNFLQPALIKDLVQKVNGTIVECNTAYGGGRADTESHLKAAADHGFTAIAPVDIMDSEGETALLVHGGKHLKENYVGAHYPNYDFTIILSHFKGHAMGGFGGAIKNMSIGIASSTVAEHCGEKIIYISVANNLSVDCDCDASPEDPKMGDIGILASLDPVALDKACTDLVRASEDHGKIHLIERIDSRHGMHTLEYGEQIGLGCQKYELVKLD